MHLTKAELQAGLDLRGSGHEGRVSVAMQRTCPDGDA